MASAGIAEPDVSVRLYELEDVLQGRAGELADIAPRLGPLLTYMRQSNVDEATVRCRQQSLLRDRAMLMPSPFKDAADRCDCSWFGHYRFFYLFHGQEDYFWITGRVDRGYCLAVVYFPARRVAVALYPHAIEPEIIADGERLRRRFPKPSGGEPVVITGYPHALHVLWNELPALEHAAAEQVPQWATLAVTHEPFGPVDALFPAFAGRIRRLRGDYQATLNAEVRLLVGLGGWTIPVALRQRIVTLASQLVPAEVREAARAFRAAHDPVLWLSVKRGRRTIKHQAEALAALIGGFAREYPAAGFILDGTAWPWTAAANPNWNDGAGHQHMDKITVEVGVIIDDVLSRLDRGVRAAVKVVSGVAFPEEVIWGKVAGFYFCHGGSMQHKIGWLHQVPGVIHSNARFLDSLYRRRSVLESPPPIYFLSEQLVVEDAAENYTELELRRKDQDYSFADMPAVIAEVVAAFRASRPTD